jgi:deazaflavin-dependent oxidoreductase (nitroreductase family)
MSMLAANHDVQLVGDNPAVDLVTILTKGESMPGDFAAKAMNAVHRGLLRISAGKIGWRLNGMPILKLTTTGRKSGEPRSVMLASPIQTGATLVIVASRGGDDRNPAWFLNLRDNPEVEVSLQGKPARPMRARVADAEERARLWPQVVARSKGYGDYQTKTERQIPLVLLEDPAG